MKFVASILTKHMHAAAVLLLMASATPAWAQSDWKPLKPIRWIVPFAAGGAADIVSRVGGIVRASGVKPDQ